MPRPNDSSTEPAPVPAGTQTLVRGLGILELVAQSRDGVTVQQAADHVGIHRTMALRSLAALASFNLVRKGRDGRFRVAAGVVSLARDYLPTLREAARPVLEELAAELGSSTCLFVADGDASVPVLVIEPDDVPFHLTFRTGSRHPSDRGSASYAINSLQPPHPDEPPAVTAARTNGFAQSTGEVEPGAWGISVPLDPSIVEVEACVHTTTFRPEVAERAAPAVIAAARRLEELLTAG